MVRRAAGHGRPRRTPSQGLQFLPEERVADLGAANESTSALVDRLALEYGLSRKQRQTVSEYCDLKGEEYVRSKLEIVRALSCRNAAGALLASLRDDWQPAVSTKGEKTETRKKPVRAGNRNVGNSNEYCDFSQYRCSQ